MRTLIAASCAAVSAVLILAPAAHADPPPTPQNPVDDMNYIKELYSFGITKQTLGAPTPEA